MASPYSRIKPENWRSQTIRLLGSHPLAAKVIVDAVLETWRSIFESKIGKHGIRIGADIRPTPQIMGSFLHELLPLEIAARNPGAWRRAEAKADKDLVYIPDSRFSIEIKTSSHPTQIFGNRSYGQEQSSQRKKDKSGYYVTVNFEKFSTSGAQPRIRLIRFGWLDHTDWIAQTASTGQQARLRPEAYASKLLVIYNIDAPAGS